VDTERPRGAMPPYKLMFGRHTVYKIVSGRQNHLLS